MNWKKIYNFVLKNICEKEHTTEPIVELGIPSFEDKLVKNPDAKFGSIFSLKLNDKATEKDYEDFCNYIYAYIGEDIRDYIYNDFDNDNDFEKWSEEDE